VRPTSWTRLSLFASVAAVTLFLAAPGFGATHAKRPVSLSTGVVNVTTSLAYQSGTAAGTGMVLTGSGEILTNNHVIRGSSTVNVIDPNTGRSYPATVVGYSVTNDVAVLQLQGASKLKTVALGTSAPVKVNQKVTALGNAGGANGKPIVATGKVTGVGVTITASDESGLSEQLDGLIRIDAPIRPGDSGGPLLNAAGRVIGMNTAGSLGFQLQGSATQGYAIPIGKALGIARQIVSGITSTSVHVGSTPFLGVSVSLAAGTNGLVVGSVVAGSPAGQAGLVAGDTITALDGQPVTSYNELSAALLMHNAGDSVALEWTDQTGAAQSATVQTGSGPPQ
jgi:S1-C subfamily serine protease